MQGGQGGAAVGEHTFNFDHIFGMNSTQEDVYETVGRPLVSALFDGFNACLMAYGQTGR